MKSASSAPAFLTEMCEGRWIRLIAAAICIADLGLWSSCVLAAGALSSPWANGAKSAARLIASGSFQEGTYNAGIEIKLHSGTLTYWRTPGDAGVPPTFSFTGSVNLAEAQVHFPAPKRYDEGGIQSFGYEDDVIFPLDVKPRDPKQPVEVALDLHYATCDQICLPAEAKIELTLDPQQKPDAESALIATARSRVPEIRSATDSITVTPISGAAKPAWTVQFLPNPSAASDFFAEAPAGYYFDTKRAAGFELVLAQKPSNAKGPVPVTLTLVDGLSAYQSTIRLDVAPAAP
jgi:DsbC/DsbD-like thiol-disulfide interchange protein